MILKFIAGLVTAPLVMMVYGGVGDIMVRFANPLRLFFYGHDKEYLA